MTEDWKKLNELSDKELRLFVEGLSMSDAVDIRMRAYAAGQRGDRHAKELARKMICVHPRPNELARRCLEAKPLYS